MGDNFGINCQSSLPLVGNNAELEYKSGNTWASASNTLATGNTFSFDKVSTSVIGTLEYRVKVAGVLNLFQESVSESLYLLSKPPKLNLKPYLTIKKLSESGEAFIKLDVGNNQISAMLQTSQTQNGPWRDIGTILSGETLAKNLPFGVWIRVTYLGNGAINAGSSDPFQVLITPTLQCNFPKTITEKRTFQVTCELNQTIKTTPVSLQYLSYGDTWVSLDEGSISGKKSVLKFTLTGGGSSKFRIRSEGLANTYTAFQSNVTQISFKSNTTSTSSKSKNPVGNIPKGKVDKESNAYKFMFNFGSNVAEVSLASDSGMSQCSSAKNSGLIRVRGVPQYLGIQAAQIRSYLDSSSGFQGCLDGFGK
jgi:hypothetical protein